MIKPVPFTPRQFRNLLFRLAGVFSFIKLNSVVLSGEFKGKAKPGELKALFLDEKVSVEFKREVKVCRWLMGVGIER